MKKVIALFLVAVMSVSLVACGAENQTSNNNENVNGQTSTTENESTTNGTESQPTNSTESQSTSEPEDSSAPAFDTNWAGAEYEMPIPEPPFSYDVEVDTSSVRVTSTNGGSNGDVTHENILTYCTALKEVGFNVNVSENVIGERYGRTCYEFRAKHENGNSVELIDDGGGVMIFVTLN